MIPVALILEDSRTQAQIISRMVERRGWVALTTDTVKAAMDIIQTLHVDALFLDIFVGERNTLKHFDRFRLLAPNIPIVLMTAGSTQASIEDTLAQARRVAADHVVRKPFSDHALGDILAMFERAGVGKRPRHILIIDDSQTVCRFTERALSALGVRCSSARSMEDAFDNVEIAHVDLVLCDVFMPGIGGLKGMRMIRSAWPWVKVIAMSAGLADQVSELDALNATRRLGVDGQILKPFLPEDLAEIVGCVLDIDVPRDETAGPADAALSPEIW